MKFIITEKQYKKLFNQNEILFAPINEITNNESSSLIKGLATLSTPTVPEPKKYLQQNFEFKMTPNDTLNVYNDGTQIMFSSLGRMVLKKGTYTLKDLESIQTKHGNLLPATSNVSPR